MDDTPHLSFSSCLYNFCGLFFPLYLEAAESPNSGGVGITYFYAIHIALHFNVVFFLEEFSLKKKKKEHS